MRLVTSYALKFALNFDQNQDVKFNFRKRNRKSVKLWLENYRQIHHFKFVLPKDNIIHLTIKKTT